jgi:tetratricopeptide (TPR) repeat protein
MSIDYAKSIYLDHTTYATHYLAQRVFLTLNQHGYNTFMVSEHRPPYVPSREPLYDYQLIRRKVYLLLLTPATTEHISQPRGWLRENMHHARQLGRTIVVAEAYGFDFRDFEEFFVDELAEFRDYPSVRLDLLNLQHGLELLVQTIEEVMQWRIPAIPAGIDPGLDEAAERLIERDHAAPNPSPHVLSAEWHLQQGMLDDFAGRYELAEQAFNTALKLFPAYGNAYHSRGQVYLEMGRYQPALADAERAVELLADTYYVYNLAGMALARLGRADEALLHLSQAIDLNPTWSASYTSRARARFMTGDYNGALRDAEKATNLNPADSRPLLVCGLANFCLGNFKAARQNLEQYHHARPDDVAGTAALALVQMKHDDSTTATRLWQRLLNQDRQFLNEDWVMNTLHWPEQMRPTLAAILARVSANTG